MGKDQYLPGNKLIQRGDLGFDLVSQVQYPVRWSSPLPYNLM